MSIWPEGLLMFEQRLRMSERDSGYLAPMLSGVSSVLAKAHV